MLLFVSMAAVALLEDKTDLQLPVSSAHWRILKIKTNFKYKIYEF